MTDYQLAVIGYGSFAPVLSLAASAVFWKLDRSTSTWRRIASTSHGAWFALAFVYAVAVCPFSDGYGYGEQNPYAVPFRCMLALGLLSTLASLLWYRGPRLLLLLHLFALPVAAYSFLIGAMAIAHDWM